MTTEPWRLGYLDPWKEDTGQMPDFVKHLVFQAEEAETADELPHVVPQLPMKPTVQGLDSPHHLGDHTPYDMLTRAPMYSMTCHTTRIPPHSPKRGAHRHVPAPTLFCLDGAGWEVNDDDVYNFNQHDMLVVPPYTIHQHGGDENLGATIFVFESSRITYVLGSLGSREQHKLGEQTKFPEGTEGIYDENGELKGYRIKRGVLDIPEDIDVILGPNPKVEAVFQARRSAGPYTGEVTSTYDRYIKQMHDEVEFCRTVTHVLPESEMTWEQTRQGKLKWVIHPDTVCAAKDKWIYFQELEPGSRSGMHRHASEELVIVLSGRGYDVHDDERWNWEEGDLIVIPAMTAHQHFNTGNSTALTFHGMPRIYSNLNLGGIEQLEDCPEWQEAPARD